MIDLYAGPMWSGKTTSLISRVAEWHEIGKIVLVIKPAIDDRYDATCVTSHDGLSFSAVAVDPSDEDELRSLLLESDADAIAVDEVQFFPTSLVGILQCLPKELPIVAAGLDMDCFGEPFPTTSELSKVAHRSHSLLSKCKCGSPATRTQRLDDSGAAVTSGDVVQIGGVGSYVPRCVGCWIGLEKPTCARCTELEEVLGVAHSAFMRERGRADSLAFVVERLEREVEMLRVEATIEDTES